MKPLFTIHEGEFLVGDHITRKLGRKFDVWVPVKDSGVDLLVTDKLRRGKAVGLQVKFSRGFGIDPDEAPQTKATSWFTLDPKNVRTSPAEIWVFAIMTLRHERYFVVIPTSELRKRMPRGIHKKWNLYLRVCVGGLCYQVRDLTKVERYYSVRHGVRDRQRDFSEWLERWELLAKFNRGHS